LVTGFEPFGAWGRNPSAELAASLDGWSPAPGWTVAGRCLPVDLRALPGALYRLREETAAAAIVHVGLAGSAGQVAVERIGINVADFEAADNSGLLACDEPLLPGGAAAYFSTLPVRAIVRDLREAGIPAGISNSAGTYLCNAALYLSLHAASEPGSVARRVGFIHVPPLPEQVAERGAGASMSFDLLHQALRRVACLVSLAVEQ
jgi:pyroglutamyl-peptidase